MIGRLVCLSLLVAGIAGQPAFATDPVRYTLSLKDAGRHVIQITLELPPGAPTRELQLPVWNALYQVRDFSQYMSWIRVEDVAGSSSISQINASRWRVNGAQKGARVIYEMVCDLPGPFGMQLNQQHAFFNLAEILLYQDGARNGPHRIKFQGVPEGWKIATPLQQDGTYYSAESYDKLVDSPVEIGTFSEKDLRGPCGTYRLVVDANDASQAIEKIAGPVERIVAAASRWMDDCPFQTYTFIYHFSDTPERGGMEHAYSTAITLPERTLDGNLGAFKSVTAHEFFHLWNVKRIRPQSLQPIDYTKENYTRALWFSEGVDSTAADCILFEAGLLDEHHYLEALGQTITGIENRPAHLTQSVEQSSLDAWLEKYPYYGGSDRSISYYDKGELLGVLLDLRMRAATQDRESLQTLFRWMNQHYAKQGKFFADSAGVREAAEQLTHISLNSFFADYVASVREIPWNDFFAYVGLRVVRSELSVAESGFIATQKFDQPPIVIQVDPGSDAERAGLQPDDSITAINGEPAGSDFEKRMNALGPGELLRLQITRNGNRRELQWTLGSRKQAVYQLSDLPVVTPEQKQHRELWLFNGTARPQ